MSTKYPCSLRAGSGFAQILSFQSIDGAKSATYLEVGLPSGQDSGARNQAISALP